MPKSLVINCSTGQSELVDIPEEIKPIEDEPHDEVIKKRKNKRQKANQILRELNGKDIDKMSRVEQTSLLIAICQILEIADDKNVIALPARGG